LWSPHVVTGGYVAFHDVGEWPGVTRFYEEFVGANHDSTRFCRWRISLSCRNTRANGNEGSPSGNHGMG